GSATAPSRWPGGRRWRYRCRSRGRCCPGRARRRAPGWPRGRRTCRSPPKRLPLGWRDPATCRACRSARPWRTWTWSTCSWTWWNSGQVVLATIRPCTTNLRTVAALAGWPMESRRGAATAALTQARRAVDGALSRDRGRLLGLWSRWNAKPADAHAQAAFATALQASVSAPEARAERLTAEPVVDGLPIAAHAGRIVELVRGDQVVV